MIINADGSSKATIELLWENPDISVVFPDQTIGIDTNTYPVLYAVFAPNAADGELIVDNTTGPFFTTEILCIIRNATQRVVFSSGSKIHFRDITVTDDGLVVSVATSASSGLNGSESITDNSVAIPYRIYGSYI